MRNKILNILIICAVFLFLVTFPIDLFVKEELYITLFQIGFRIIFIIFFLIFNYKAKISKLSFNNFKITNLYFFAFIPICCCNLFYLIIKQNSVNFVYDYMFLIKILSVIIVSISEELLFRGFIENTIRFNSKFLTILISSIIFGLFHLIYYFSSLNPIDLIRVVYTTGLGFVLGYIYEYGNKNLTLCMIFHFLFNFLNDVLFTYLFTGSIDNNYYINAVIISLYGILALSLTYLIIFRQIDLKEKELIKINDK